MKYARGRATMNFIKAAQTNELAAGDKKKIQLDKKAILLVNIDGEFYAIENKCPHMGGSLYDGKLESDMIICPRHGSAFNVKTGKNMQGAKIAFVKMKVNDAKTLPVKVEGSDILIGIE